MAIGVMNWVWDHSRSRHGARLVLLAIADCASGDGTNAWPSVTELKRKTGLGERAVQAAVAELVTLGEIQVDYNAGPKGCNRYRVIMRPVIHTPAESAPPQNLHPANTAPPAESAPPQISTDTPADSAPVTIKDPSLTDHLERITGRLALEPDDDLILKAVIGSIHERTRQVIGADQARPIAALILTGRSTSDPVAYVRKTIRNEKNPVARFLAGDLETTTPPAKPEWCRKCDGELTRMRELDDGRVTRCPECNPNARKGSA